MKTLLQSMFDRANFHGYALYNGKKYHSYKINQIANRLGITLEYNCPA